MIVQGDLNQIHNLIYTFMLSKPEIELLLKRAYALGGYL